jgi:hypothetical protein
VGVQAEPDLAGWGFTYCRGTMPEGPLNEATVAAKKPDKKKNGPDTPAKKSVQTVKETPTNEEILL